MNHFETIGKIDDSGNLVIYEMPTLNRFLEFHKAKGVSVEVRVVGSDKKNLTAYFYGVLIPRAQEGYNRLGNRFTKRLTEDELKKVSPVTVREWFDIKTQKWVTETRSLTDLSRSELFEFIEDLYIFCAQNLDIVLPSPNDYKNEL